MPGNIIYRVRITCLFIKALCSTYEYPAPRLCYTTTVFKQYQLTARLFRHNNNSDRSRNSSGKQPPELARTATRTSCSETALDLSHSIKILNSTEPGTTHVDGRRFFFYTRHALIGARIYQNFNFRFCNNGDNDASLYYRPPHCSTRQTSLFRTRTHCASPIACYTINCPRIVESSL